MSRLLDFFLRLLKWPTALVALLLLPGSVIAFKLQVEIVYRSPESAEPFLLGLAGYGALWVILLRRRSLLESSFWSTLEHEFTHILFTLLTFGRVRGLVATHRGGGFMEFEGSRNWLVAISPYFFPTLSLPVILMMQALDGDALRVANLVLGITVSYHLTSTWRETHAEQADLQQVGFPFAWALLPTANVAAFGMILGMAHGGIDGLTDFCRTLWEESPHLADRLEGLFGLVV
jgi:hypothetical protein